MVPATSASIYGICGQRNGTRELDSILFVTKKWRIFMRFLLSARWLLLALLLSIVSVSSHAGVLISVGFAPPALPVYEQPPCPEPGLMWTPGYWAYDQGHGGHYWVPGAWVPAPFEGALWTPPYWGWEHGHYIFHEGYWSRHVGYYGGVNYGFGYGGVGFSGGEWHGRDFAYNTAIVHVDRRYFHHTFEDRRRVERGWVERDSHVAFSGGPHGIHHDPGLDERIAEHEDHREMSDIQRYHIDAAHGDTNSFANHNGGHPTYGGVSKPLDIGGANSSGGTNTGSSTGTSGTVLGNRSNCTASTPKGVPCKETGNTGGTTSGTGTGTSNPPLNGNGGGTGTYGGLTGSTSHIQTNMSVQAPSGSGGGAPNKPVPCTTGYVNGVCGSGTTTGGHSSPGLPGGACPSGQIRGPSGCTGPKTGTDTGSTSGAGNSSTSGGACPSGQVRLSGGACFTPSATSNHISPGAGMGSTSGTGIGSSIGTGKGTTSGKGTVNPCITGYDANGVCRSGSNTGSNTGGRPGGDLTGKCPTGMSYNNSTRQCVCADGTAPTNSGCKNSGGGTHSSSGAGSTGAMSGTGSTGYSTTTHGYATTSSTGTSSVTHGGSAYGGSTYTTHSMSNNNSFAPNKPVPCTTGYVNGVCGSGATTGGNRGPGLPGGVCPYGQVRLPGGTCGTARTPTTGSSSSGTGTTPHYSGAQPMISHSQSSQASHFQSTQPSRSQGSQPSGHHR
jgi:hypothetical protein